MANEYQLPYVAANIAEKLGKVDDAVLCTPQTLTDAQKAQVKQNLGVIDGQDGENGKSAYEVWLEAGNTGSTDEFFASLKGETGGDGPAALMCTRIYNGTFAAGDTETGNVADFTRTPIVGDRYLVVDGSSNLCLFKVTSVGSSGVTVACVATRSAKGDPGVDGSDGTSVTVSSVSESTEDGGSNVVTFSDGKTMTVKNGNTGAKGDKGDIGTTGAQGEKGADGYTPVKGVDYYTEADKTEMVNAVIAALPVGEGVAY